MQVVAVRARFVVYSQLPADVANPMRSGMRAANTSSALRSEPCARYAASYAAARSRAPSRQ